LRSYATFSHPNALAGFLLVSLFLILPFVKKLKFWAWLYGLLVGLAIIFSFSRSVWFVGLFVFFILMIKKTKRILTFILTPLFLPFFFIC